MKKLLPLIIMLMLSGSLNAETNIKNNILSVKSTAVFVWLELDSNHQKKFKEENKDVDEYTDVIIKIDGVEKKFTFEEFLRLLGFKTEYSDYIFMPNYSPSNLLTYEGEIKQ